MQYFTDRCCIRKDKFLPESFLFFFVLYTNYVCVRILGWLCLLKRQTNKSHRTKKIKFISLTFFVQSFRRFFFYYTNSQHFESKLFCAVLTLEYILYIYLYVFRTCFKVNNHAKIKGHNYLHLYLSLSVINQKYFLRSIIKSVK